MRPLAFFTSCTLAGLSGLHVAWAVGSAAPFRDRGTLADAVVGTEEFPPPAACIGVATALAAGAALATEKLPLAPSLRRLGLRSMAAVLVGRGVLGLLGKTELVSPGSNSARFLRLDRRIYAPLCVLLSYCSYLLSRD